METTFIEDVSLFNYKRNFIQNYEGTGRNTNVNATILTIQGQKEFVNNNLITS